MWWEAREHEDVEPDEQSSSRARSTGLAQLGEQLWFLRIGSQCGTRRALGVAAQTGGRREERDGGKCRLAAFHNRASQESMINPPEFGTTVAHENGPARPDLRQGELLARVRQAHEYRNRRGQSATGGTACAGRALATFARPSIGWTKESSDSPPSTLDEHPPRARRCADGRPRRPA